MMREIKVHKIKLGIEYADMVLYGYKPFEVRYNDRDYQVGDYVEFQAVNDDGQPIGHRINGTTWRIMYYVLEGLEGLAEGYVAFTIQRWRANDR